MNILNQPKFFTKADFFVFKTAYHGLYEQIIILRKREYNDGVPLLQLSHPSSKALAWPSENLRKGFRINWLIILTRFQPSLK